MPEFISIFVFVLGIVQGTSSFTLIICYVINKYALITKKGWRDFIREHKGEGACCLDNDARLTIDEMSIEQTHLILMNKGPEAEEFNFDKNKRNFGNRYTWLEYKMFNIYFFLHDFTFIYYVLYFGISFLGFYSNELFYSFHLLDVIPRFPDLQNVCKAVTANIEQLFMTFVLMGVTMYIYTTIMFFYLMETAYDYNINGNDSDHIGENRCTSLLQCYMTVFNLGLIMGGGFGDVTDQIHYQEVQRFTIKFLYDVSFFLLVKIILYNILFGIIIDTFAQLRQERNEMEDDKQNVCYICNHTRLTFDKEAEGGFYRHITRDHNLWKYVQYMVHLDSVDDSDYTGIESYVSYMYEIQDMTWMPRQKALVLENSQANNEEEDEMTIVNEKLAKKNEDIDHIIEKMGKLEAKLLENKKNNK